MRRDFLFILSELNEIKRRDKSLLKNLFVIKCNTIVKLLSSHVDDVQIWKYSNDDDKTDRNSTVAVEKRAWPGIGDTDVLWRAVLSCDPSTQVLGETPVPAGGGTGPQERRPASDQSDGERRLNIYILYSSAFYLLVSQ